MKRFWLLTLAALAFAACRNDNVANDAEATATRTPVTVTNASTGAMSEGTTFNATSRFMLKTVVKAPTNGYLIAVNATVGQRIARGAAMFAMQTKEAQSLGNVINKLDSSLRFQGTIRIPAPASGYVTQLGHQVGDYVQDGEPLSTVADKGSFVFLLHLPYELKPLIASNKSVTLRLPDGSELQGTLGNEMPAVDSLSQALSVPIHVANATDLPENLVAKVMLNRQAKALAVTLPKAAVLTNEAQSEWWIMKLVNDSTAVKVPVQKGIETTDKVEIVSPTLSPGDRIVVTGNYGLPDTAGVIITNTASK